MSPKVFMNMFKLMATFGFFSDRSQISTQIRVQCYKTFFWIQQVFCAAFICLQFGFVIFWQKEFGAKAAHKMLVKLTLGLKFQHSSGFNAAKPFLDTTLCSSTLKLS
jgi:hypothetical protein